MSLTDVERAALGLLTAGDGPFFAALRAQLAAAEVVSRDTGASLFTEIRVAASAPRAVPAEFHLSDVWGEIAGRADPAHFVLHGGGGRIECLAGHADGAAWDPTARLVRAYFVHEIDGRLHETPERDPAWALATSADTRATCRDCFVRGVCQVPCGAVLYRPKPVSLPLPLPAAPGAAGRTR
ncbi:MAG: hypothetical protein KBD01_04955 [Acidobacteria bacterium]|nr:hypothetical protein [Acidobacteriota bacterium]